MPKNGIGTRMASWWYLILVIIDLIQAENLFGNGGGFLTDPFLELIGGGTTPVNEKSSKSDSSCVSNGALAGAIIGTLLLSAFVGFLTWMVYLRQKLQELHSHDDREGKYLEQQRTVCLSSNQKQNANDDTTDQSDPQLPSDDVDYKFGTFPFRQSQTPSVNGHYNHTDWLNRVPTSFRSVNKNKDLQTMDIELLNPTFCGLNFSITGNMRAGIFVKEILDKKTSEGHMKLNSSDQLRTGDRIIALTVCFESIVYEDALTILSYASPYPVILRVQRPTHSTKVNVITEKTSKVKWRDDFEHYDNDTTHNPSFAQPDISMTVITDTKSMPSITPKKSRVTPKGNKSKTAPNTVETTRKNLNINLKKPRKFLTSKPTSSNKTTMKSVTNAVISYLHYRGHPTDTTNNSEATLTPYYDSPYDYYGTNLNRNNNNSLSNEPLTAVTSLYTIQLSPTKANPLTQRNLMPRRCERRLSSPARILPLTMKQVDKNEISLENIDTCV